MYKLTIVGGPQRGLAYSVSSHAMSIGRINGNDIVLPSNRVSKRHCVLVVDNTGVTVKDEGSSNGTFVNGVLAKSKKLSPGDRISVGEYVLELSKVEASTPVSKSISSIPQDNNVVPFPGVLSGLPIDSKSVNIQNNILGASSTDSNGSSKNENKKISIVEKIKFNFDKYVINFLYNLNEKHEWKTIIAWIFGASALDWLLVPGPALRHLANCYRKHTLLRLCQARL